MTPDQTTTTIIYVALVDEGTPCWRPVQAINIDDHVFRIADQPIPEDELWEFHPGEIVRCDDYDFADGRSLRASSRVSFPAMPF